MAIFDQPASRPATASFKPVARHEAPPAQPPTNQTMNSDGKARLLVVEDNPDTLTLLRYMLQAEYTLAMANNVEDALSAADAQSFDLFLFDINLGEERSGVDLLRLLRDRPAFAATPAVALTAYAMPGDRERFLAAGFTGYLSKPFTRQSLQETVKAALLEKAA